LEEELDTDRDKDLSEPISGRRSRKARCSGRLPEERAFHDYLDQLESSVRHIHLINRHEHCHMLDVFDMRVGIRVDMRDKSTLIS
jgi:hypothetical protein